MRDGATTPLVLILMFTITIGAGEALVGVHLGYGTIMDGADTVMDGAGTTHGDGTDGTTGAGAEALAGMGALVGATIGDGEVTELGAHLMAITMATITIITEEEIMHTINLDEDTLEIPMPLLAIVHVQRHEAGRM